MNHLKVYTKILLLVLAFIGGKVTRGFGQVCPVSNEITITVTPNQSISITGATTICSGGGATLTATPSNGTGGCTIQWQSSSAVGGLFTDISSANATTYAASNLTVTTYYRATYTCAGSGCSPATSNTQAVTVVPDLSITAQPQPITECVGGTLPLSVTVSGGTGTITYQWQSSATSGGTYVDISGATSSTYTPQSVTAATTFYRVVVNASGVGCDPITSTPAQVIIVPDLTISTQPQPLVECVGGALQLSVTPTAGTGTGTTTYQWQSSSTVGGTYTDISGATASTYTPSSAAAGTTFYKVVISASGNGCGPVTSNSAQADVTPNLTVTTQPQPITECVGGALTMNVVVANGTGTITYQWQQSSTAGGTYTDISGATSSTYTPPSATAGTTFYRVVISANGNGCAPVTSNSAQVDIIPDLVVTAQPQDISECIDGTNTLSVTISGGTSTITYQWQSSTDGSTWVTIPTATASTYTPASTVAGTTYYHVIISASGNGCGPTTSTTATVQVLAKPTITITAPSSAVCVGGGITFNATTTGGTGTCTIQWQQSTGGSAYSDVPGANNPSYTTPALNADTKYRAKITCTGSGCCN